MKNVFIKLFLCFVLSAFAFSSCSFMYGDEDSNDSPSDSSLGTISLKVVSAFSTSEDSKAARGILCTNKIHLTLYSTGDNPTIVSEKDEIVTLRASRSPSTLKWEVPVGTYTLKADVYNYAVSEKSPIVFGSSKVFEVKKGGVTQVGLSCIPYDAEKLDYDDSKVFEFDQYKEKWFNFTAESKNVSIKVINPDRRTIYVMLTDNNGVAIRKNSSTRDNVNFDYVVKSGESYYIGFADVDTGKCSITINLNESSSGTPDSDVENGKIEVEIQ